MGYVLVLGCALMLTLLFLGGLGLGEHLVGRARARRYLRIMGWCTPETGLRTALDRVRWEFPRASGERAALEQALAYLEASLLRDYPTALGLVERGFPQKGVARWHRELLERMEEEKRGGGET